MMHQNKLSILTVNDKNLVESLSFFPVHENLLLDVGVCPKNSMTVFKLPNYSPSTMISNLVTHLVITESHLLNSPRTQLAERKRLFKWKIANQIPLRTIKYF